MNPTWFLLFGGSSPDGRGDPEYVGRTLDADEARKHFLACQKDPYSKGCVKIASDKSYTRAVAELDFAVVDERVGTKERFGIVNYVDAKAPWTNVIGRYKLLRLEKLEGLDFIPHWLIDLGNGEDCHVPKSCVKVLPMKSKKSS